MTATGRDVRTLPKAHLHLHFTGAMRHATLIELAEQNGVRLPDALTSDQPPELSATDERGWFRFQRLYDTARSVLQRPDDIYRLVREVAEDELADGSRWLEIQVDPSGYASRFDGLTATFELMLDAVRAATAATGMPIGVIVGANRTRHPLDARTLARLAVRYVNDGVIGFGLANDERRGRAEAFADAFRIAREAGLAAVPHGGELSGPDSVRGCLDALAAVRIGHGVRSVESPELLARIAEQGVALEVCPASNVALGVFDKPEDVPLRRLVDAGIRVALSADDPLLFGSRLADQYQIARDAHAFSDDELAALARSSVSASLADDNRKLQVSQAIDEWLVS
ncbi:MAG TPA: adenosine deaminase [Actinomycetes bacterium]|nr:adenosine deaminase [Actinomycetes bacterium]